MAAEAHAEHVVDLALLELGGREQLDAGVDLRQLRLARVGEQRLHVQALDALHVEQLVVDAEARLGRQVVGAVQAGEEAVAPGRARRAASAARRAPRPGSTTSVAMPR